MASPPCWAVKKMQWYPVGESESLGGNHHIYFDVLDEQGKRVVGVGIEVWWSTGMKGLETEEKPGEPFSANYPMSASRNDFNVKVNGHSDIVTGIGMGQMTPDGFNPGAHTSTVIIFQRRENTGLPPLEPPPILKIQFLPEQAMRMASQESGVLFSFLASLAWRASRFGRNLFQLDSVVWQTHAHEVGATDINNNLDNARVAAAYLRWLLAHYNNDLRKAIYAFHVGTVYVDAGYEITPMTLSYAEEVIHGKGLLEALREN